MRIEARLKAAEEAAEAAWKDCQSTMPKIKWGDWDWDWDDEERQDGATVKIKWGPMDEI